MLTVLSRSRYRPLILALILLFIAESRLRWLPRLDMEKDEVWSVWQTFGSPQQVVEWTPFDWPPLYYLIVGGWQSLVGIHPFALRVMPILVFLLGAAALYRVTLKLFDDTTALVAVLGYSAMGYTAFISTALRAYVFLLALTPFALWFGLRYFQRPTIRNALLLTGCLVFLVYIHESAVFAILVPGICSLFFYGRRIWRWWLPGILTVIVGIPLFLDKFALATDRLKLAATIGPSRPNLIDAWNELYAWYIYRPPWTSIIWSALLILCSLVILIRRRRDRRAWMLVAWIVALIAVFFYGNLIADSARHVLWGMVGLILVIAWGASLLPRPITFLISAIFIGLTLIISPERLPDHKAPVLAAFEQLKENIHWGDVILIDPQQHGVAPEEWDYFTRVYFPEGLQFVHNAAGYRRIWYVSVDGREDPVTSQAVRRNRVPGTFFGPWDFLTRLYEGPPDPVGVAFENGMRFMGVDTLDSASPGQLVRREGQTVHLRLWWSVDKPVTLDYSVMVVMRDRDGKALANADGPPKPHDNLPSETSRWVQGQLYVEDREFTIPDPTKTDAYSISLMVYFWRDRKPVAASGMDSQGLLPIQELDVKAW